MKCDVLMLWLSILEGRIFRESTMIYRINMVRNEREGNDPSIIKFEVCKFKIIENRTLY